MGKRSFITLLLLFVGLALLLGPVSAHAASGSGSSCQTAPDSGSAANKNCDNCINSFMYQNIDSGNQIINAIFNTINSVLNNIEYSFFNGIIGNSTFQAVMSTAFILYIALFGLMVTFNITSYRMGEILNRLIKVAIVYMLTSPGAWGAFNTYIQNPIIGTINQIIHEFTVVAENGSGASFNMLTGSGSGIVIGGSGVASGQGLDPVAFSTMFGSSLTTVFSVQMFAAITATAKTGFFGWLIAIFLAWALIEFFLMMLGALITYAKAIIGLAFLFGIAPLFFIFLMFENTRQIFFAWLGHVLTFALQPILLFSFLAFYVALVNDAAPYLFTDPNGNFTNYCWTRWFSVPGTLWDSFMWAPTQSGGNVPQSWNDTSGNVLQEHINVPNAVYFLMLCHLAKTFTSYINDLASTIGEGVGPGVDTAQELEAKFKELFASRKGK